ncbi:MAG: copper resistance protein CopC [Clostridia bacterium]|nr:copper resistance protein CopC [Clostridia bacterium]
MKKTSSVLSILLALLMVLNVTAFAAAGDLTLTSAKVGDADLEGATIPSGSVITLTFSNNVTDTSVFEANAAKIKVKNADGADVDSVTVSAGSDKAVINVDLGEIADGGYTLNLGKDISAKNTELTLGTKVSISFTVGSDSGEGNGNGNEGEETISLVSAKVGDTDLKGSKIPAGSEITLTFSNNGTDESVLANNISKIKVKTADDAAADATVSAGSDKAVFIVTLGSNLAKGDYKLTVGKDLTAKNGKKLGEKVEISFSVKGDGSGTGGGNNPLDVVSVKAGDAALEGAELEASGTIVITFSRGMTENQAANFEQIGIYNEKGEKVEGVTFTDFTKDSEGNTYTELTYNDLPGGSYTLKLGKDLKANNGNTLGEDATYSFTVAGAEKTFFEKVVDFFTDLYQKIKDFFAMIIDFFKQ